MKAVLISIQPKWCELIASGKKTVEVRKTKPKIDVPFKCYIYATEPRNKKDLALCFDDGKVGLIYRWNYDYARKHKMPILSGKVIGEFVCDEIFPIRVFENGTIQDYNGHAMERSCVPYDDIVNYIGNGCLGYGWHITDLVIYDKPKELSEFKHTQEHVNKKMNSVSHWECGVDDELAREIKRPPQSWCYVEKGANNEP
jgi:predicted transcriptional regulator